jgi:26S proteasome regulatory subunit N2
VNQKPSQAYWTSCFLEARYIFALCSAALFYATCSCLHEILCSFQDDALLAYQIAFDLVENENQAFLLNVRNRLASSTLAPSNPDTGSALQDEQTTGVGTGTEAAGDVQMRDGTTTPNGNVQTVDPNEIAHANRLGKIKGILSGETSIQLTLQFLYSHNR